MVVIKQISNLWWLPQILLAKCMSLGIFVTSLVCIMHKLVSLNNQTKYDSMASWNARTTTTWMWNQLYSFCKISLMSLQKAILGIKSSEDFWHFWISFNALVPGWKHLIFIFLSCITNCGIFSTVDGWDGDVEEDKGWHWGMDLSPFTTLLCMDDFVQAIFWDETA